VAVVTVLSVAGMVLDPDSVVPDPDSVVPDPDSVVPDPDSVLHAVTTTRRQTTRRNGRRDILTRAYLWS
jgi:hypothetical protein